MTDVQTIAPHVSPPTRRWPVQRFAVAAGIVILVSGGVLIGVDRWQTWPLRTAQMELAAGNPQRVISLTNYYLDSHPLDPVALAIQGRALVELGDGPAAAELFERIGAASSDDVHAWAQAYMLMESWSRASNLLEQFLRMEADDPEALYELSTCMGRLGMYQEGLRHAQRLTKIAGQGATGELLQAIMYHDFGNAEETSAAFARLLSINSDAIGLALAPADVFLQYANALVENGRTQEALPFYERSVAIAPTGESLYRLGRVRSQLGDTSLAEAAWRASLETDPRGVSPRESLAEGALARNDLAEAADLLAPLTEVGINRPETAYLFQRLAAAEEDETAFQRWKEIADSLRDEQQRDGLINQFVVSSPDHPWAVCVRAHRFAKAQNWRQAHDLLEGLPASFANEPFVSDLRQAVRDEGELPSLDLIPINEE